MFLKSVSEWKKNVADTFSESNEIIYSFHYKMLDFFRIFDHSFKCKFFDVK